LLLRPDFPRFNRQQYHGQARHRQGETPRGTRLRPGVRENILALGGPKPGFPRTCTDTRPV